MKPREEKEDSLKGLDICPTLLLRISTVLLNLDYYLK
jgi:hypothetical protein